MGKSILESSIPDHQGEGHLQGALRMKTVHCLGQNICNQNKVELAKVGTHISVYEYTFNGNKSLIKKQETKKFYR